MTIQTDLAFLYKTISRRIGADGTKSKTAPEICLGTVSNRYLVTCLASLQHASARYLHPLNITSHDEVDAQIPPTEPNAFDLMASFESAIDLSIHLFSHDLPVSSHTSTVLRDIPRTSPTLQPPLDWNLGGAEHCA